jgi:hypothetical protein
MKLVRLFVIGFAALMGWPAFADSMNVPAALGAFLPSTSTSSPTGTTSTTGVMMGLGSVWKLTPSKSGNVTVDISGFINSSVSSNSCAARLVYGTGTAPANQAAPTGTSIGGVISMGLGSNSNGLSAPFSSEARISGLTVGTQYWFDVQLTAASASTTCTIQAVSESASEQ